MKKAGLSLQITMVFLVAFILTSVLLGVLITRRLDNVYENNVFESLEAEGKALKQSQRKTDYPLSENIAYISYISKELLFDTSGNIGDFLDENAVKLLINKAAVQEDSSKRYVNTVNGKVIYYVILHYQGFFDIQKDDVLIVLTDDTMKMKMVRETTLQILFVSLISFVLGYLIILFWVSRLVSDTKKITGFLNKMGDNHYKTEVITKRKDEIGDLVEHIEIMRNKIIRNEKQKQEIIQGISHDLKTPIAIIQSYAEALRDGMCEAKEVAAITEKESKRLNDKVTKLLHLTRLNYVDVKNRSFGSVRIDQLLNDLIISYHYQTEADIEMNLSEVSFTGDKESWLIAIENIMDNAIRYAKTKVRIELNENELSIYNDGSHIDERQLTNIFNAYEKSVDGKFGLGLSIVKRTVEMFGYHVEANNFDDGVIFKISNVEKRVI
ncbi:MAG: HAMP domain-containing histidine kinase [Clostridia bacterium]|nr:HAMP domain-containing histidine kinase [Clostridia bacterium]